MRLGMHTYSRYHHGVAEDWAGFQLPWPRQMDIWRLMDYMVEVGLEGLHLDDTAFDSMDTAHFSRVRDYARAQNLYLEYNFALPSGFKLTGAPVGEGDLDMRRAYELIHQNPDINRINIELDLQCPLDNMQEALRIEREALQKSVQFCRKIMSLT